MRHSVFRVPRVSLAFQCRCRACRSHRGCRCLPVWCHRPASGTSLRFITRLRIPRVWAPTMAPELPSHPNLGVSFQELCTKKMLLTISLSVGLKKFSCNHRVSLLGYPFTEFSFVSTLSWASGFYVFLDRRIAPVDNFCRYWKMFLSFLPSSCSYDSVASFCFISWLYFKTYNIKSFTRKGNKECRRIFSGPRMPSSGQTSSSMWERNK